MEDLHTTALGMEGTTYGGVDVVLNITFCRLMKKNTCGDPQETRPSTT
jgi:hypothetical protein